MPSDMIALTSAEVAEIRHFLDSLEYEYDLILQDIRDPDEVRGFQSRSADNTRHQSTLAAAATDGGVLLARTAYQDILADFGWLIEEWHEAMKHMDSADLENYERASLRLAALLTQITGR